MTGYSIQSLYSDICQAIESFSSGTSTPLKRAFDLNDVMNAGRGNVDNSFQVDIASSRSNTLDMVRWDGQSTGYYSVEYSIRVTVVWPDKSRQATAIASTLFLRDRIVRSAVHDTFGVTTGSKNIKVAWVRSDAPRKVTSDYFSQTIEFVGYGEAASIESAGTL